MATVERTVERSGDIEAVQSLIKPVSKKIKGLAIFIVITGVALTALGAVAIGAYFISPYSHVLMCIGSFTVLGGGLSITTISSIALALLFLKKRFYNNITHPMTTQAHWSRSINYVPKEGKNGDREACNLDFSYADPDKGFGIVLDGVGHNNCIKGPKLGKEFDELIKAYIPITQSSSIEEAYTAIFNQLKVFSDAASYPNMSCAAMSFCQVVEVDGVKHLFLLQWADTRVLIQKNDGSIDWLDKFYTGGSIDSGFGFNHKFGAFLIEKGSTIIGFSDGIGEFMTREEFEEVLNQEGEGTLLEQLVEKIQNNEHPEDEMSIPIVGKNFKNYKEESGDDVSLFCLKV